MTQSQRLILSLALLLLTACASPSRPTPAAVAVDRHLQTGGRLYQAGQLTDAKTAFHRAIAAAELIDDPQRLVHALLATGASELLLGNFLAAENSYRRAATEARAEGLTTEAIQASIGLAETARQRGDTADALDLFSGTREQPGLTVEQHAQIANGMALCLMASGDLEMAEQTLAPLEPAAGEESTALQASTLANLARLRLRQNRLELAESLATRALSVDRQLSHPPAIAADHALLGEILQVARPPVESARHFETASRIFRQTGQHLLHAR